MTVARAHSTWFHLVKSPRYFAAVDEVREAQTYPADSGRDSRGSKWHEDEESLTPNDGRHRWGQRNLNPLGKLPGSVWTMPEDECTS